MQASACRTPLREASARAASLSPYQRFSAWSLLAFVAVTRFFKHRCHVTRDTFARLVIRSVRSRDEVAHRLCRRAMPLDTPCAAIDIFCRWKVSSSRVHRHQLQLSHIWRAVLSGRRHRLPATKGVPGDMRYVRGETAGTFRLPRLEAGLRVDRRCRTMRLKTADLLARLPCRLPRLPAVGG